MLVAIERDRQAKRPKIKPAIKVKPNDQYNPEVR
jgi:hypothetical protein